MYREEVINIVKNKIAFMGTSDNNHPHVRPMKPHLCQHGRIWLVSHLLSKKMEELQRNKRVELCFLGDSNEVLRLSGEVTVFSDLSEDEMNDFRQRIMQESPELRNYFTGADDPLMVLHRLKVYHVSYITKERELCSQVDLAQDDDPEILFGTEHGFFLS